MTSLRLKLNSTVRLTDQNGVHRSYYVRKRLQGGYMFEPHDAEGELHFHLDANIFEYYIQDRMVYRPADESKMSEARRERSRKTWEATPRPKQLVAERRETIILSIKKAIKAGMLSGKAFTEIPAIEIAKNAEQWAKEDFAVAWEKFEQAKAAGTNHDAGAEPKPVKPFPTPCARTAWEWMYRYLEMGNNVLALVPYFEKKGRRNQVAPEVEEAMLTFIKTLVERKLIGQKVAVNYVALEKWLEGLGLTPPSVVTFAKRIRGQVSGYELIAATQGKRAADESRNIAEYVPDPEWALAQVEIDHTLANIHLVCDITGAGLGRPWISMVLDRKTRVILGGHLSFLAPSWATLSRAIAHAIWIKDLSAFPGHEGRWNHHGVFDWAYTDRGMDFISNAGRRAGTFVGFDFANLPGFSPWLKGKIERCFGTLAVQCYNYADGLTSSKDPHYNPRKNAKIFVSQFKAELINWIIDYNHREHGAHAGHRSPDDIWKDSVSLMGGVPPVPTVSTLRRMMGKSYFPKISNHGMRVFGLDYAHPRMEELREGHDIVGRRFEVRVDPYELAAIDFHDGNEWLTAYCRRPDIADGVTAWQHKFHLNLAADLAKNGKITADMVAMVRAQAQTDFELLRHQLGKSKLRTNGSRLAQYLDQGQFLTPVSFIAPRPTTAPLLIPGSTILEEGRYLVPPRPNFQISTTPEQLMLPAPQIPGKARKKRNAPKPADLSTDQTPEATGTQQQTVSERMQARLAESRKFRGVA